MKTALHRFFFLQLVIAFLLPGALNAQIQSADQFYSTKYLQNAIRKYSRKLKKDPDNAQICFNLAEAYRLNGDYVQAEGYYEAALEQENQPQTRLLLAQMQMANGKYTQAAENFKGYATTCSNENDIRNANALSDQCKRLTTFKWDAGNVSIAPAPFNSPQLDFSPVFYGEDKIVFSSNRTRVRDFNRPEDPWTQGNFVDLYYVEDNGDGYSNPDLFTKKVNSIYHEGPCTFSPDLGTMYFTRSDFLKGKRGRDSEHNTRLQIFSAKKMGEDWKRIEVLSFNDPEYSYCHPALSANGKVLVFSSDMPGGEGGMDLYMTRKIGQRAWSKPENLGPEINTAGNEVFPWIDSEGTLYFSSNMHLGLGGLDIFKADFVDGKWKYPSNLGAPFNSLKDDFGYVSKTDGEGGFFTSNRGESHDDIFVFEGIQPLILVGTLSDCGAGRPIPGASILLDERGKEEKLDTTDAKGRFLFEIEFDRLYLLEATKVGFVKDQECTGSLKLNSMDYYGQDTIQVSLKMAKKVEVVVTEQPEFTLSDTIFRYELSDDRQIRIEDEMVIGLERKNGEIFRQAIGPKREIEIDQQIQVSRPGLPDTLLTWKPGLGGDIYIENGVVFAEEKRPDTTIKWIIGDSADVEIENVVVLKRVNLPDSIVTVDPEFLAKDPVRELNLDGGKILVMEVVPDTILRTYFGTLCKIELREGEVVELHNVYFDFDKYDLRGDGFGDLEVLLKLLNKYPEMTGMAMAHTDSRGSDAYNLRLSQNRANSTREFLVRNGIAPERLEAIGFGERLLKNDCGNGVECDEEKHQRNRRVEFMITGMGRFLRSKERWFSDGIGSPDW